MAYGRVLNVGKRVLLLPSELEECKPSKVSLMTTDFLKRTQSNYKGRGIMHPEAVCYKESFLLAKPEEALHDF